LNHLHLNGQTECYTRLRPTCATRQIRRHTSRATTSGARTVERTAWPTAHVRSPRV